MSQVNTIEGPDRHRAAAVSGLKIVPTANEFHEAGEFQAKQHTVYRCEQSRSAATTAADAALSNRIGDCSTAQHGRTQPLYPQAYRIGA
jgi:hypothetical protein